MSIQIIDFAGMGTESGGSRTISLQLCGTRAATGGVLASHRPSLAWKRSRSEGTMGLWHVLSSTHAPRLQEQGCQSHGRGDFSWLMQAAGAVPIIDTTSKCWHTPALAKLHCTALRATQPQTMPAASYTSTSSQPGSLPHLDSTLLQSPTLAV